MKYRRRVVSGLSVGAALAMIFLILIASLAGLLYFSGKRTVNTETVTTTAYLTRTISTTIAGYYQQGNASLQGLDPVSIYRSWNASVVTVEGTANVSLGGVPAGTEEVLGSGFVVNYQNSDYIVTNFHVVDSVVNMTVAFWNGDAYPAKAIGTDPYSDLAVVTVQAPVYEFHPIDIASSSVLQVGQPVAAIGNPFGLSGSMTVGIISQLGRTLREATAGNFSIADVIQFSAPINPGNSGGPLLDSNGHVLGITTAIVGGSQGLGFAIPSDTILREIGSLINNGSYSFHPYVGIFGADMNYWIAQAMGVNATYGVLIEGLASGGPASQAGIKAGDTQVTIHGQQYIIGGDIIVAVNGTRIVNYDSFATFIESNALPGETVVLTVVRSGQYVQVPVTLGARPPPTTTGSS